MKQICTHALFLALFLPFFGVAQIPEQYSENYYRYFYPEQYFEVERLKAADWDFIIPIEERIPVVATRSANQPGNWGYYWHGSQATKDSILKYAKRPVVVFVFDTGAGFTHKALDAAWWKEKSKQFVPNDNTPNDTQSHSTHVSGIIAAVNDFAPIGVASELVKKGLLKVIPYQVLNDSGAGAASWIEAAILDANKESEKMIAQGAYVIYNFSLGGTGSTGMRKALEAAEKIGVDINAAAGNTYKEGIMSPANYQSVYAIGALEFRDNTVLKAPYSTWGDGLYAAAAGSAVYSTVPNNGYAAYSGTSMATPTMAAIKAIVASCYSNLNAAQVSRFVSENVMDVAPSGYDIFTGAGSPMLTKIFQNEPPKDDDTPKPEPTPEFPDFGKNRVISVDVPGLYQVLWKTEDGAKFEWLTVTDIEVEYTSKLHATKAQEKAIEEVSKFYTNRGFVTLKGDDWFQGGYWSRHFLEMLVEGVKLSRVKIADKSGAYAYLYGDQHRDRVLKRIVTAPKRLLSKIGANTFVYAEDAQERAIPAEKCIYRVQVLFGKAIGAAKSATDTYTETHLLTAYDNETVQTLVKPAQDDYYFMGVIGYEKVDCVKVKPRVDLPQGQ